MSDRARTYRKLQHLEDLQGTAVTVQAMVFGNAGASSGAGVAFSRDPSTGAANAGDRRAVRQPGRRRGVRRTQSRNRRRLGRVRFPQAATQLREALRRLEARFCRRAGRRIHHRERQAVDAADARGQAHAAGGAAVGDRFREGGTDRAGRRLAAPRRRGSARARQQAAGRRRSSRSGAAPAHRPALPSAAPLSIPDSAARLAGERRAGHSGSSRHHDRRCRAASPRPRES